jgi:hypothetical protein
MAWFAGKKIEEISWFETMGFGMTTGQELRQPYLGFQSLDWSGFWICCSSRCYINSKRLRSETNTPTINCTSQTIGF